MYYLGDTNVFLHAINDNIYPVSNLCKQLGNEITITDTILKELEPGYYLEHEDETAREIYTAVYNLTYGKMGITAIRKVSLDDIPGAKEELKKLRAKYYGWLHDTKYLRHLIESGIISSEDIRKKSFRNKDLGECELIVIAKCSSDTDYKIVSNDKGKVFLHPDQNLFDDYASPIGLIVIKSEEWLSEIEFCKEISGH